MNQFQKRVIICCGVYCNLGGRADALRQQLEGHAEALNRAHDAAGKWNEPRPLGVKVATCLDLCEFGPNLVLHPGHHTVSELDAHKLQQLIDEQLG